MQSNQQNTSNQTHGKIAFGVPHTNKPKRTIQDKFLKSLSAVVVLPSLVLSSQAFANDWVMTGRNINKVPPKQNFFMKGQQVPVRQAPVRQAVAPRQAAPNTAYYAANVASSNNQAIRLPEKQTRIRQQPQQAQVYQQPQYNNGAQYQAVAQYAPQAQPQQYAQVQYNAYPNNMPLPDNPMVYRQIQDRVLPEIEQPTKYILRDRPHNTNLAQKNNYLFMPVNYNKITSQYGMRVHPIKKVVKMHTGVDFAAPKNTPIHAAQSGIVTFAGWRGGYGKTVIIKHNDSFSTLYGHAESLLVLKNQAVQAGQIIARVGSTGDSTGYHLHFEILKNKQHTNPREYMVY